MRGVGRAFLAGTAAALLLALAVPLPAQATPRHDEVGRLLRPDRSFGGVSGADATGEGWVDTFSRPAAEVVPRCLRLGRQDAILLALPLGETLQCRAGRRTALYVLGLTNECDNARGERVTPAQQRRCALDGLREAAGNVPIVFTVDGRRVADLNSDRYLVCSPQRRVQVPPDALVPPGPRTVTACGYVAWLVDLPPGTHTLRTVTEGVYEWSVTVTVADR